MWFCSMVWWTIRPWAFFVHLAQVSTTNVRPCIRLFTVASFSHFSNQIQLQIGSILRPHHPVLVRWDSFSCSCHFSANNFPWLLIFLLEIFIGFFYLQKMARFSYYYVDDASHPWLDDYWRSLEVNGLSWVFRIRVYWNLWNWMGSSTGR